MGTGAGAVRGADAPDGIDRFRFDRTQFAGAAAADPQGENVGDDTRVQHGHVRRPRGLHDVFWGARLRVELLHEQSRCLTGAVRAGPVRLPGAKELPRHNTGSRRRDRGAAGERTKNRHDRSLVPAVREAVQRAALRRFGISVRGGLFGLHIQK